MVSLALPGVQPQEAGAPSAGVSQERGRGFAVGVKSAQPALIAVRIRHESCPICRSVEAELAPVVRLANEREVLLVTIDLSSDASQRQSALLIGALGLDALWPVDAETRAWTS